MKLKNLYNEILKETRLDIKWIVGYVDSYGKIHYKVIYKNDVLDSHNQIWPGPKHGKWRWMPSNPNHINTYGEEIDFDVEDKIWSIIDNYKTS